MIKKLNNSISFKLGLLFSSVFLILLLLLGYILYGLFSQTFIDYITQDLLVRGDNHARVLADKFSPSTIKHVAVMEQNVYTRVVITDANQQFLDSSDPVDNEMELHIDLSKDPGSTKIINQDWQNYQYIATVSPINKGKLGFVYMYYPTEVLKEIVLVLKGFITITSFGVIFIAVGLIVILSKRMTKPLLQMKDATNKMASGEYKQDIEIKGTDELAQLGNSIQMLGEKLQYYEDTRNEFLASVSHELRTPLTYIKGYSDVLIKGIIKECDEQKKYLKIINDEAQRVTHLVDDLFEISKIQTGTFSLKKESVNIITLLKKIITSLSPIAAEKGLNTIFCEEINVPSIKIDPRRMEQVFYNLIENAIKYTDEGFIKVSVIEEKELIKIIIQDTGIGIPEKELPRIWDRFYRVDKSRTRKTGGTGLGLYIVKEIIQLHGGQIELTSSEAKGTTVIIKLNRKDVIT